MGNQAMLANLIGRLEVGTVWLAPSADAKPAVRLTTEERDVILARIHTPAPPMVTPPYLPNSLHWLGDREAASITQHAIDITGCVMFFKNDVECTEFMKWLCDVAVVDEDREGAGK